MKKKNNFTLSKNSMELCNILINFLAEDKNVNITIEEIIESAIYVYTRYYIEAADFECEMCKKNIWDSKTDFMFNLRPVDVICEKCSGN